MGLSKISFILDDDETMQDTHSIGAYLRGGLSGAIISQSAVSGLINNMINFDFVDADVNDATDVITSVDHRLESGQEIQLSTTGALPAPLAPATSYFVIRLDKDTFQLAASKKDAELLAPIEIDITSAAGGGTHTLQQIVEVSNSLAVSVKDSVLAHREDDDFVSGDMGSLALGVDAAGKYKPLKFAANGKLEVEAELDADFDFVHDEDAPHQDGDSGAFMLSIRIDDIDADNSAQLAGANGDYQGVITNADGALYVIDANAANITKNEDDAHASGDAGSHVLAVRTDLLAAQTDADGDYSSLLTDHAGSLYTSHVINTAFTTQQQDVTSSSGVLIDTPLSNRRKAYIVNTGNKDVFIGPSGVTKDNGFPLPKDYIMELDIGPSIVPHAVAKNGTQDVRIMELS